MIKKLFFAIALLFSINAYAQAPSFVIDNANVLNQQDRQQLISKLEKHASEKKVHIVVLTEKSISDPIEEFALEKARQWKIGLKGEDSGILFVVDVANKLTRIEVGYGIEGVLPDSKIKLLQLESNPYFAKSVYEGINFLTNSLIQNTISFELKEVKENNDMMLYIIIAFIVLVIFIILFLIDPGLAIDFLIIVLTAGKGKSGGGSFGGGGSSSKW